MCIGYIGKPYAILFEYPRILVSLGVLESVPKTYWLSLVIMHKNLTYDASLLEISRERISGKSSLA